MSWLAQNWVWVVIVAAVAWFFLRGSRARGHAGVDGLLESVGGRGTHAGHAQAAGPASAPEAAVDPVSSEAVPIARALSSVYQDKIYYFASKENRERFEAAPQEYAQKVAGQPLRGAEPANEPPRRRGGGCC